MPKVLNIFHVQQELYQEQQGFNVAGFVSKGIRTRALGRQHDELRGSGVKSVRPQNRKEFEMLLQKAVGRWVVQTPVTHVVHVCGMLARVSQLSLGIKRAALGLASIPRNRSGARDISKPRGA